MLPGMGKGLKRIQNVMKPENVALHGLLLGMVPVLVPEVLPPVGFSMQYRPTSLLLLVEIDTYVC